MPPSLSGTRRDGCTLEVTSLTWDKWLELLETDPDFVEEFAQTFDNPGVKEADDEFDPDTYNSYVNMELCMACYRDKPEPEVARVTKKLKDPDGNPIGVARSHPTIHPGC
jgi:hypothetical protein